MRIRLSFWLMLPALLLGAGTVSADELRSSSFQVLDPVFLSATSTQMSSVSFRVTGALGQAAIGTSSATSFRVSGGFLYFPFLKTPTVQARKGNGKIILSWSGDSGFLGWTVGGYNIGRATVSGGPYAYTAVGATNASATSSAVTGLTNGATYYYVVRAEDAFGNSIATSSEVSITPSADISGVLTGQLNTAVASSSSFIASGGIKCDVDIPANFLSSGETVLPVWQILPEDTATTDKPLPSSKLGADTFYEFSWYKSSDLSQVTSFDQSATLTFTYTDADISGIEESTLAPYRWNGSEWVALAGATLDTSANTITVNTASFSIFGLFGTAPATASSPSSTAAASGGGVLESFLKAFGLTPPRRLSPAPSLIPVDLVYDGKIGLSDFSAFLFLMSRPLPNPADFNGDRRVDLRDLSILLAGWNEQLFVPNEDLQRVARGGEGSKEEGRFRTEIASAQQGSVFRRIDAAGAIKEYIKQSTIKQQIIAAASSFFHTIRAAVFSAYSRLDAMFAWVGFRLNPSLLIRD